MSCPLSFTFVPAERHAPCMRLTEAFQCSRQDIRSLSLRMDGRTDGRTDGVPKGRRESPPRRFFPGLAAGPSVRSVARPAAGGARTSRRTPAALPPSLCRSFVRYPSSTLHSVGRAGRRGAERRAVGRTDGRSLSPESCARRGGIVAILNKCCASVTFHHIASDPRLSQRFEVSPVSLVFFYRTLTCSGGKERRNFPGGEIVSEEKVIPAS